ncbi:AhpC/TSA family protein [Mucilaginibacter conchicola]|uniref:AhpC/TSA family protein n=1 Tax=Mucilaginibacter conchicola TaxID=2303333 RepID=A0A372P0U4_9SPHI|nr:TlpA disulfide reductase family protein [Mucilaginibacter conchicola]RFZ95744.1 AhpC/TSA family protein [Mucilaginibacter conchicola]
MKKLSIIILSLIGCYSAAAQTKKPHAFILRGTVDTHTRDTIDIQYLNEKGETIKDSIITNKATFVINGTISEPTTIWLNIRGKDRSYKKSGNLFIEPKEMTIVINKENVNQSGLSGSITQNEFSKLNKDEETISNDIASATGKYSNETDDAKRLLRKGKIRQLEFGFINTHPDSYLSPFLMKKYAGYQYRDSLALQYSKLAPQIKNSAIGKQINAYLQHPSFKPQTPKVGDMAADFMEKGIDNKQVRLYNFRGKQYVLLDFWASWCGPCLAMLPKVKALYDKYHAKGLEVIGINMDYTPEKWKKAVAKENMTQWKNIFPTKIEFSNECPLIAQYGITTIPALFLIDKEGKLVAIINDEQSVDTILSKTLAEALSNPLKNKKTSLQTKRVLISFRDF